jgi:RNA recognition motif-containing protein
LRFYSSAEEIQVMENRVYIGNIPFKATGEDVRGLFAEIGEVESVNYVTDARSGKPKGFAFVVMASEAEARKAIEALNGKLLLGRPLSVSAANTQEPRERRDLDAGSGRGRR